MSDKKRTTVTTIETHEVWIIRKAVPELSEVGVITPETISELAKGSPLIEAHTDSEVCKEDEG